MKHMRKITVLLALVLLVGALLPGCGQGGSAAGSPIDQATVESVEILLDTEYLLQGDSTRPRLDIGEWILDGTSGGITWTTDDESIATVDKNHYVTGVAPGTFTLTAEYAGHTDSRSIQVIAVEEDSPVTLTASQDAVELSNFGEATVTVTLEGADMSDVVLRCYDSASVFLLLTPGEADGQTLPLSIKDVGNTAGAQGYVTVLAMDPSDPVRCLAALHIQVQQEK